MLLLLSLATCTTDFYSVPEIVKNERVNDKVPSVLFFYSETCHACDEYKSEIVKLYKQLVNNDKFKVYRVELKKNRRLWLRFRVLMVPKVAILHNGKVRFTSFLKSGNEIAFFLKTNSWVHVPPSRISPYSLGMDLLVFLFSIFEIIFDNKLAFAVLLLLVIVGLRISTIMRYRDSARKLR